MKLVIIGGVAGGAAAAARARRLDESAEIVLFERGEYVSFASCGLPYYAGNVIQKRDALLVVTPDKFKKWFNVDIHLKTEVIGIDTKKKVVTVKELASGAERTESYDHIVLSPGAEPIIPPIEGANLPCVHKIRTMTDIDAVKEKLDSGSVKHAVVIGGGFIGLEMAENIKERDMDVALVERLDQVMMPFDKEMAVFLHRELTDKGIHLYLNEEVIAIQKKGDSYEVITRTGNSLPADCVIMSVGVKPETTLARDAGLKLGKRGILVDTSMGTSDPFIFAVGDAVETVHPITQELWNAQLAGPAAKQARVAVNTIFGKRDEYKGTQGTSIVKIFSVSAAMTGASEKMLKRTGVSYEKVYTISMNHAGYYPGARMMIIKTIFDPQSGTVLGAQIIGGEGVDKRIDVLATAVRHALTVKDIAELELAYAPPYGSTKDPVNIAGMAACNHLEGLSSLTHWDIKHDDETLLDVRMKTEVKKGAVPHAINIPLPELRKRLGELPKNKPVAVFCQVGLRAHIANRILLQNGFNSRNVSGGYMLYHYFAEAFGQ
ncbi:MAG: FAD-dependent oxidoreductase [Candidatus Omnitrophica bacterium]|nr:FAD-dependent oxidoreductase [Candidatus Omnitrophota bacterium]